MCQYDPIYYLFIKNVLNILFDNKVTLLQTSLRAVAVTVLDIEYVPFLGFFIFRRHFSFS